MANYSITTITITKNSLQNEQIEIDNKELIKSTEYKNFLKYAKDIYDRP